MASNSLLFVGICYISPINGVMLPSKQATVKSLYKNFPSLTFVHLRYSVCAMFVSPASVMIDWNASIGAKKAGFSLPILLLSTTK